MPFRQIGYCDYLGAKECKALRKRTAQRRGRKTKTGTQSVFKSHAEFAAALNSYLTFLQRNPNEIIKNGGESLVAAPPSIVWFCFWIGISTETFHQWLKGGVGTATKPWLQEAAQEAAKLFTQARIDGAAIGIYKEGLVARIDNLVERQEITNRTEGQFLDSDPFENMKKNVANAQSAIQQVIDSAEDDPEPDLIEAAAEPAEKADAA